MRHMRPWGHLGLIFTLGLRWSIAAVALHPSAAVAAAYFGAYLLLRTLMTWLIGIRGLKQSSLWKKVPLIPVWDAMAFGIWLLSFARNTIRWRNVEYESAMATSFRSAAKPVDWRTCRKRNNRCCVELSFCQ